MGDLVEAAFEHVNLDQNMHVLFDERHVRPTEVDALIGDSCKSQEQTRVGRHYTPQLA